MPVGKKISQARDKTGSVARSMIVPLNQIKSKKEYVLLGPNHAFISEHDTGEESSKALSNYVRQTGREAYIYRRTDKEWVRH